MTLEETLLVLPTLNERENLEILLPQIISRGLDIDILVIDDGSTDGSHGFLDAMATNHKSVTYLNRGAKLGIGSAHIQGLSYAIENNYQYVVTMDADQTHRVADLDKLLLKRFSCGALIIGSRYVRGGGVFGWSIFRNLLTRTGHFVTSVFFFSTLDMSSGMRLYRSSLIPLEVILREAPANYDYFFITVLIYRKLGLDISQIPIKLDPRGYGNSKMNFWLMVKGVVRLIQVGLRFSKIRVK